MRGGSRYGAGRPRQYNKTEDHLEIDVRWLARERMLSTYAFRTVTWRQGGEVIGSISLSVDKQDSLVFKYRLNSSGANECQDVSQHVQLEWTKCRYGGQRPWFVCSHCQRRVAKLYLGSGRWYCRQSLRLTYPSQSECRLGRLTRKIHALEARLWDREFRPKGMRWKTYNRLVGQLDYLDGQFNANLFRRYGAYL